MAQYSCQSCGKAIQPAGINIREGVAQCGYCGALWRLSQLVGAKDDVTVDAAKTVSEPPKGCAIYDRGNVIVLRASLRSIPGALMMTAIALFWNGIVSVFLTLAIASLYTHFYGPVPSWFPSPMGTAGCPIPLAMTIFMSVFLLPFIAIGLGMIAGVFLYLFGRVEVILSGADGAIRTGIGPLNWTRRFDTTSVERITIEKVHQTDHEGAHFSTKYVCLHGDKEIKFGSMLSDGRQRWLRAAMKPLIVRVDEP